MNDLNKDLLEQLAKLNQEFKDIVKERAELINEYRAELSGFKRERDSSQPTHN